MDRLLKAEELAEMLCVKKSTIYQWTHIEYIPHLKIGNFVRFRPDEIQKWLNTKSVKGRYSRTPKIGL